MNKYLKFITIAPLLIASGMASVISPPEKVIIGRFLHPLNAASKTGFDEIDKWQDIEILPIKVQIDILGSYSQNHINISDFLSIIPLDERHKFPEGELVFVSARPFNETQWYRNELLHRDPSQLQNFDSENSTEKIIRWIIIKKNGIYERQEITETDFQKIILDNEIKIPKTSPYRFNFNQIPGISNEMKAQLDNELRANINSLPTPPLVSSVYSEHAKAPPPPIESVTPSNLWWIACLSAALVIVMFVIRGIKSKK